MRALTYIDCLQNGFETCVTVSQGTDFIGIVSQTSLQHLVEASQSDNDAYSIDNGILLEQPCIDQLQAFGEDETVVSATLVIVCTMEIDQKCPVVNQVQEHLKRDEPSDPCTRSSVPELRLCRPFPVCLTFDRDVPLATNESVPMRSIVLLGPQ